MTFLHSILACLCTIVTFTVETKSSVSTTGILPEQAKAEYTCTYKKGQLTAGNSATLLLTGWQGLEIHSITLWMRSNKTSGAGTLQMTADGHTCWNITDATFDNGGWRQARQNHDDTGGFCTEYVPVSHTFTPSVKLSNGEVSIAVTASQSSLYIEKYEIDYSHAPKRAYTISFSSSVGETPSPITEEKTNAGIILPTVAWAKEDWQFAGWSEQYITEQTDAKSILPAGSRYFPINDCTLYAVFTNALLSQKPIVSTDELHNHTYLICTRQPQLMLYGSIDKKYILTAPANMTQSDSIGSWQLQSHYTPESVFMLDMLSDTTGYIYHPVSGQPIGYQDGELYATQQLWTFRKRNGAFLILTTNTDITYYWEVSLLHNGTSAEDITDQPYISMHTTDNFSFLFFEVPETPQEILYSSNPLSYIEAIENIVTTIPVRKYIRDGQLILERNNIQIDLLGRKIR